MDHGRRGICLERCDAVTAVTHTYDELLLRHIIVGIGEATFVVFSPAYLSDLFPERMRGRVLSIFYLAIPVGTAFGYIIGGQLGASHGWRMPFMICAAPGVLLAIGGACFARTRARRERPHR